ncbi:hypothetical protein AVU38_gp100 [Ralstonia phage RSL2]|uniref:Uncharacterized protein n=1 Tax=Ralstonia phage RSL2 TaxID=1585840 RepID=A0A0A8J9B2_9CAUD|nr:hypothetical protein AVU38_gp100 [Ralstonia phage RSL2]BAQ02628.1 hypothetical protein [Ralstonia phage RSL2]
MKGLPLSETHERDADGNYVLKEKYAIPYRESVKAQLESWVAGKPVHNDYADECCPDFSCCSGSPWPEEKRKAFAGAKDSIRHEMLMGALSELTTSAEAKVHVAGTIPDNTSIH